MRLFVLTIGAALLLGGCAAIKPYEKEFLLDPLMDDAGVAQLRPTMIGSAQGRFERLSSAAPGGGGATSCPTCGG